jgi:hypothetical protein
MLKTQAKALGTGKQNAATFSLDKGVTRNTEASAVPLKPATKNRWDEYFYLPYIPCGVCGKQDGSLA